MKIPRLGIESELQLPAYTTATAMPDPSHICDLSSAGVYLLVSSIQLTSSTWWGLQHLQNSFKDMAQNFFFYGYNTILLTLFLLNSLTMLNSRVLRA